MRFETFAQVLLVDMDLPSFSGPDAVFRSRNSNPATRIVILSDPISDNAELALFKRVREVTASAISIRTF